MINKGVSEEDVLRTVETAWERGWKNIKLYFMIGLPTETMEDVEAIVELTRKIVRPFPGKGVTVSVSSFVPKPHTPFQWAAQDSPDLLHEKQELLREKLRRVKGTRFKYHQIEMSLLEALIARGDRRIGNVIEEAWRLGQRFDGWTEQFKADRWKEAIQRAGINPNLYTGAIPLDEPLPWDHIGTVLTKEELKREWGKAHSGIPTLSCLDVNCAECAACATREGGALRFNRLPIEPLPAPSTQARLGPHIYRGIFQKAGPAAFFSHLDMGHALRMAFRRSGLRLAFTEGFTPLPKVSYGPPLPVGVEGFHEMIDFGLAEEVDPQKALSSINTQMPEGMRFLRITGIPGLKSHISRDISAAVYETEDPCCEFTETGGSALHERGALWASRSVSGRLYMLVHPEAKITAVFKAASGQERSRSAFRRTAIVLQGEDWNQFLPPPRASTES